MTTFRKERVAVGGVVGFYLSSAVSRSGFEVVDAGALWALHGLSGCSADPPEGKESGPAATAATHIVLRRMIPTCGAVRVECVECVCARCVT